ncbi:MAG: hypothetical protein ACLFWB_10900 [Armatimonadota bacterium]
MSRRELVEWIAILVIIVAWWPRIFFGYDPLWYHALVYWVSPIILFVIFLHRFRRMQAGFKHSEEMIEQQTGRSQADTQAASPEDAEQTSEADEAETEPRAEQARTSLPWMQSPDNSDDQS